MRNFLISALCVVSPVYLTTGCSFYTTETANCDLPVTSWIWGLSLEGYRLVEIVRVHPRFYVICGNFGWALVIPATGHPKKDSGAYAQFCGVNSPILTHNPHRPDLPHDLHPAPAYSPNL